MAKHSIQEFHSDQSPWEVFQNLYAQSQSAFFLDSFQYQPPNQSYSYLGADPFLEVTLEKGKVQIRGEKQKTYSIGDFFSVLRDLFDQYRVSASGNPFFTGGAVGFLSYEFSRYCDKIRFRKKTKPGIPDLYLGFYRDFLIYDHRLRKYYLVTSKGAGVKRFQSYFQKPPSAFDNSSFELKKFHPEMPRQKFEQMVKKAKAYIEAGDIYQANLSQRFSFEFKGSALKLYDILRRINPSPFSSFLKRGPLRIISSSPERLVRKTGIDCETRPIAGTRGRKGAVNLAKLKQELFRNEKERAEHIMLVDLERNDLGRVCNYDSVKVEEFLEIEKYSHVIHLVSKITGRMSKGKDEWDLIRAMFPGGTVTGCPKLRCMEIIDELEPVGRGLYTGSLGYIGFNGDLDLNIVIRTLILEKNKGHLQVGAGIVYDSDPTREYEETLHKGEALAEALVRASVGATRRVAPTFGNK